MEKFQIFVILMVYFSSIIQFVNLTDANSSESQTTSPVLIPSSLNTFEKLYLEFISTTLPVFNQTYNDITNIITEFESLNGIQLFLSSSALFATYLPIYTVCKYETDRMINGFNMIKSSQTGENILLTPSDLLTLANSRKIISSGYVKAAQGIVNTIDAIHNTIYYDSDFNDDNGTLHMSNSSAEVISNALAQTVSGNQEIVQGYQLAVNLNVTRLISYQTDSNSAKFLKYLFKYLDATLQFYIEIVSAEEGHYNAAYVYNISLVPPHKFSTATDKLNNIVETSSLVIASFYKNETNNMANFDNELLSELNN